MKEEYLMTGPLEPTNSPYAVAKIAGIESCRAYHRQYGARFLDVMPNNMYGPGDNEVVIWGTGNPRREFLYSDDMAEACVFLMGLPDDRFEAMLADPKTPALINIGCGDDVRIADLARLVAESVGFTGKLTQDPSKPEGTPCKLLDIGQLEALGWSPKVSLNEGISFANRDFFSSRWAAQNYPGNLVVRCRLEGILLTLEIIRGVHDAF